MNAHALPRGWGPLLVAELVARELDCFMRDSVDIPRHRPSGSVAGVRIQYSRALRVASILERRRGEPDVSRHLRTEFSLCLKAVLRPCPGPRWGTGQVGKPCLPTKAPQPRTGDARLHEIKHDGFRVIARKDGRRVRLYSRPGNDVTWR